MWVCMLIYVDTKADLFVGGAVWICQLICLDIDLGSVLNYRSR